MTRQERIRNSVRWQKTRALARRRDGNRCRLCGSSEGLQVHHLVSLEDGGSEYDLRNLATLCVPCHAAQHRGHRGQRVERSSHGLLGRGEEQTRRNLDPDFPGVSCVENET